MASREKCSFVVWFSLQWSGMSIEHDSSSRLHSSGVQCRVLLESAPLSLSEYFFQHVTLIFRSTTGIEEVLIRIMLFTPAE